MCLHWRECGAPRHNNEAAPACTRDAAGTIAWIRSG
jgi:hypothetical protein